MNIMMACGHAANAHTKNDIGEDIPCCIICAPNPESMVVVGPPNLEGRIAKCGYSSPGRYWYGTVEDHNKGVPSRIDLAFFEFKGEGSRIAMERCKECGFADVAHEGEKLGKWVRDADVKRHPFVPHGPYEFDSYYCGCYGWD